MRATKFQRALDTITKNSIDKSLEVIGEELEKRYSSSSGENMSKAHNTVQRLRKGDLCMELHPDTDDNHKRCDIAREIVGHFHSKGDLVQVVNVLLSLAKIGE